MKKTICLLLTACMLFTLAACGAKQSEAKPWDRSGYFTDEEDNFLSITWMEDIDEPGWYVGFTNGEDSVEDSYGGTLPQEGNALRGTLASSGSKPAITVTITEDDDDGLLITVEGGKSYHCRPMDIPEASIFVTINTEGMGCFAHAEGETAPEIDTEYPFQSSQINLAEPANYTIVAWPMAGYLFEKWTRNGEDFSTEPQITVLFDESADYVAVFAEDPDWQNPVMNFVGEYVSGDSRAKVECLGAEEAWITIERSDGEREATEWLISGRLDTDTLTISYFGGSKSTVVYDDIGEIAEENQIYGDGTGTIIFHENGTFTWHEDQSDSGEDLVFELLPVTEESGTAAQIANPWREVSEEEAAALCQTPITVPGGARNVRWSVLDSATDLPEVPGPMVQLTFELDGNNFTVREQVTGDPEADISGMYFEWTEQRQEPLEGREDTQCRLCRWVGEDGYADLCTWYDAASGASHSVSAAAEDLDGFDLMAIVEALYA